jgi:Domain of unknown function (DUF4389)
MYPITYEADFNPTPSRGTTFFRLLLAIPWFVVALFWGLLFYITHFVAWIVIIIIGRYPQGLFNFNSGVLRFGIRLSAWIDLQTDEWPPFGLSDDDNYPIRVKFGQPAERQSRLKAFFRIILALPVFIVYAYGTAAIAATAAFVAWCTIVFRGYLPSAVNDMLTYCHSFQARVLGYTAFLTDDYPPIGLEKASSGGVVTPPPPPPAAPAV